MQASSSYHFWPCEADARRPVRSGPAARAPRRRGRDTHTPGHDRGGRGRCAVHTCGAFCRALSPFSPPMPDGFHPSIHGSRFAARQHATTRRVETTPRRCPSAPATLRASKRPTERSSGSRRQPQPAALFSFLSPIEAKIMVL